MKNKIFSNIDNRTINQILEELSQKENSSSELVGMFIDEHIRVIISVYRDKSIFIWQPDFKESHKLSDNAIVLLCEDEIKHPERYRRIA